MLTPETTVKPQVDRLFGIGPIDRLEERSDFHPDAQFLLQFPAQTLLKGLVSVSLAAGKLPQTAQMIARLALGEEQASLAKNQSRRHFDDRGLHDDAKRDRAP